ncbi:MAG: hypothetical protein ACO3PR_14110 [Limisphaerales bacterium]
MNSSHRWPELDSIQTGLHCPVEPLFRPSLNAQFSEGQGFGWST